MTEMQGKGNRDLASSYGAQVLRTECLLAPPAVAYEKVGPGPTTDTMQHKQTS